MTDEKTPEPYVSPRQTASEQYRLTHHWVADHYNVRTRDPHQGDESRYHVATTTSQAVAEHIAELHNRTFGEGQDAIEWTDEQKITMTEHVNGYVNDPPKSWVGVEEIEPRPGEAITSLDPADTLRDSVDAQVWAREFMKRFQNTQADEGTMLGWFANAIGNGQRSVQNVGVVDNFLHHLDAAEYANPSSSEVKEFNQALRSLRADPLMNRIPWKTQHYSETSDHTPPPRRTRDTATVQVEVKLDGEHLRRLVQDEVAKQAGETVWSPERMAQRLQALGFEVLNPDVQRLMRDLEQDAMEGVPGYYGVRDYLLKERQPAYSVGDAERRAWLAGYEEARTGKGLPVFQIPGDDVTAAKRLLTLAGYTVTEPAPPAPGAQYPTQKGGLWDCGILHGAESHMHITREGALKCIREQMDLTPDQLDLLGQAALDQMTDPEEPELPTREGR